MFSPSKNRQYSFPELEKILFVAFDSVELKTIRRFADQSEKLDDGLYKCPDCGIS